MVQPGDVMIGDEDGVVAFAQSDARALLDAIAVTARNEDAIKAEIATGLREQQWLTKVLAAYGL